MTHPNERRIALYACGDAGWMERFAMSRHVTRCSRCRDRAAAFRRDRELVRQEAAQLPPGLDWNRLAAEMTANIHLGLEAGECVSAVPERKKPAQVTWRPVFAAAGVSIVLLLAMFLNFPQAQRESLARGVRGLWTQPVIETADADVALSSTRNGIEIRENGSTLAIMNPGSAPPVVVVNTGGSLRARYVDSDTGQVTITNVYAQ